MLLRTNLFSSNIFWCVLGFVNHTVQKITSLQKLSRGVHIFLRVYLSFQKFSYLLSLVFIRSYLLFLKVLRFLCFLSFYLSSLLIILFLIFFLYFLYLFSFYSYFLSVPLFLSCFYSCVSFSISLFFCFLFSKSEGSPLMHGESGEPSL